MKIYINKKNDDLHDVKNGYGHFYIIDYEIEIEEEEIEIEIEEEIEAGIIQQHNDHYHYGFHYKKPRIDQDDKYFDDCEKQYVNYCMASILHFLRLW
jgi:hypothetical protein